MKHDAEESPGSLPGVGPADARRRVSSRPGPVPETQLREPGPGSISGRIIRRALTFLGGIRLRLVWWFIVVLALATVGSVVLVRQVLVQRLDARIEAELVQEVDEIRRLADGNDPATGEPFQGRIDRIFEVFLERNEPGPYEALVTFIDGRPHLHSPAAEPLPLAQARMPYPLHEDPALISRWANVEQAERDRADTPVGAIEYVAVPFIVNGVPRGVFVVANFRDLQRGDTDAASLAAGLVGLVMLIIGSLLAVRLADRILAPVRVVTRTARSISETDLSQRIGVQGYDELADLSATFNDMLERLEQAFATQRRFIDDAGHELRTPITVIRGHLDVMGDDPDDRRRTLEVISDELERMSRLVDDMLTLARADQPDFLRPRPVDVDELTMRMIDTARGLAARDWRLESAAHGRATLDEQRLMQAVLQLAANAVRHTRDADPIALGSAISDGEIRFWIRDNGPGIPAGERNRIFERFYRGRSGDRRSDGAGLGLSIVQAIAQAHGGWVTVVSEPGKGATFTVVVPGSDGDAT